MEIDLRVNPYDLVDVIHVNEYGILIVDETITPPVIPQ